MMSSTPPDDGPVYLGCTLDEWLEDFLSDDYVDDVESACEELISEEPGLVRFRLCEAYCFEDDNENLVCQALPCFGEEYVRKAVDALPDIDEPKQSRLVFGIAETGWHSVPCLVQLLEHPAANVRAAACLGLANIISPFESVDPAAVLQLKEAFLRGPRLAHGEIDAFFDTMQSLCHSAQGQIPIDPAVPSRLVMRLEDNYQTVRAAAIDGLGTVLCHCQLQPSVKNEICARLARRLDDHCQAVRFAAARNLTDLKYHHASLVEQDAELYGRLYQQVSDELTMIPWPEARMGLGYHGVVERLQRLSNDPSPDVRERIVRILAVCKTGQDTRGLRRPVILELIAALNNADAVRGRDAVDRQEAVWALQWLSEREEVQEDRQEDEDEPDWLKNEPAAPFWVLAIRHEMDHLGKAPWETVVAALHDRDIAFRIAAVDVLARISDFSPKLVDSVVEMLHDRCQQVRWRAERTLNLLVRNKSEAWERYGLDGPPSADEC